MRAFGLIVLASAGFASIACARSISDELPSQLTLFAQADGVMKIDGHLDESAWSAATPVTRFFEVSPGNVEVPPVETEARFLYDDKNIYVGIRASDTSAGAIRSSLVRRDQVLTDQDYLEI